MAAEEDWIWGNHRGGGGAPVKTVNGEQVSNLREVARGNVEVDHLSPSARRGTGRHTSFDDRDYEGGGGRGRDRDRSGDYDYDLGGGARGAGGARGGRRSRHTAYDDDDRGSSDTHPRSPRGQQQPGPPAQFVSPSHRGARKNMFVSDSEREQRTRKAREYQESLREQVEEKRRQKEASARDQKQRQQQEYDEYMSQNFRGQVSPSGGHSARKGGDRGVQHSPQRANDGYVGNRREQATPPRNGRREQATPPRNGRREQATPPRNGRREQATPPRNGRQRDGVISPIRNDRAARHDDRRGDSGERDGYAYDEGGGGRGGGNDWVSKVRSSDMCRGCL